MSLFRPKSESTRQHTQFAYEIGFYPWDNLSEPQRRIVAWRKQQILSKYNVERCIGLDLNDYFYVDDPKPFRIHWIHGKIPTEQEWNKLSRYQQVRVDLRISPAIQGEGRIALFEILDMSSIHNINTEFLSEQTT